MRMPNLDAFRVQHSNLVDCSIGKHIGQLECHDFDPTELQNFRDIMVALGRLPLLSYERSALGHEVGMEASGKIRSVGSNVEDFKPGDEVVFMKGGCIGNRVITPAKSAFHKPDSLSMAEAAGVMSVYVTSYYSLIYLARLKKGQRVLLRCCQSLRRIKRK